MSSLAPVVRETLHQKLLKHLDHRTFPQVIGELVRDDPTFAGVRYVSDMPKAPAELPAIAYRLVSRVPGMDEIETRKPRYRTCFTNDDSSVTEVWAQWMTCTYQFDVCHHTGHEADELVWELDRLIGDSVGILLSLGASEVVFDEQLEDRLLPPSNGITVRSLRWLARLEKIEFRTKPTIQQIRVRVFKPQLEETEDLVRGASLEQLDRLQQTYVSALLYVSDPSPSGIARTEDYLPDIDFEVVYDPVTAQTALRWLEPGRRPDPGASYSVRFLHWSAFSRLSIPS